MAERKAFAKKCKPFIEKSPTERNEQDKDQDIKSEDDAGIKSEEDDAFEEAGDKFEDLDEGKALALEKHLANLRVFLNEFDTTYSPHYEQGILMMGNNPLALGENMIMKDEVGRTMTR